MNKYPASPDPSDPKVEIRSLRIELADLKQENQRLRKAVVQMRSEILNLNRSLQPWPAEEMRNKIRELETALAEITNSRSWRMTAAYRSAGLWLKRRFGRTAF